MVAVIDKVGDQVFDVGQVMGFPEDQIRVRLFGTESKSLEKAKFVPVHIEDGSGKVILRKPTAREKTSPWITTLPDTDLVISRVYLTPTARLTAASRRHLQAKGVQHKPL